MKPRAARAARNRPAGHTTKKEKKKMDILATYVTDEKLETEGTWFPLSKTAKLLIARSGNPNYVKVLRAKMKEAQLDLSTGDEADQLAEMVIIDVLAETVLLGWKGITHKGVDVPFSRETARTYLKVPEFRRKVVALSENFESYRAKDEAEQGNA